MQHQLIRMSGRHPRVALIPVVRNRIRKDLPSAVEGSGGNGTRGGLEC